MDDDQDEDWWKEKYGDADDDWEWDEHDPDSGHADDQQDDPDSGHAGGYAATSPDLEIDDEILALEFNTLLDLDEEYVDGPSEAHAAEALQATNVAFLAFGRGKGGKSGWISMPEF